MASEKLAKCYTLVSRAIFGAPKAMRQMSTSFSDLGVYWGVGLFSSQSDAGEQVSHTIRGCPGTCFREGALKSPWSRKWDRVYTVVVIALEERGEACEASTVHINFSD